MKYIFNLLCVMLLLPLTASSQQFKYPPELPGTEEYVYKTVDGIDLKLWVFSPTDHGTDDIRPAIVFFFGGGWASGSPEHFARHCAYLTDRGMIGIVADYRVKSRHDASVETCIADAKSAMRWVRANTSHLGIDPERIAAGGGSAGGHLAAATCLLTGLDDPKDDLSVSERPNALVLFNPVLVLAPLDDDSISPELHISKESLEAVNERLRNSRWLERVGVKPTAASPYHHLTSCICPTIIFHGTADKTVTHITVELFCRRTHAYGNRCELVSYDGVDHGFFNYGRGNNAAFIDTIYRMDRFLVSLGYLTGPPDVSVIK